jgi:hypothetical protein
MSNFSLFAEIAFALLRFLSKNVTFEGFLVGDLPRARYFKPLLGTGIRFDLRHLECFCCKPLLADPHRRTTYGAIWGCKAMKKAAILRLFFDNVGKLGNFGFGTGKCSFATFGFGPFMQSCLFPSFSGV